MTTAVENQTTEQPIVDINNPSQSSGPATPNSEREKPEVKDETPKTPNVDDAAAKAAEEAAKAGDKKPDNTIGEDDEAVANVIEYQATGDVGLDVALDFIGKLGIAHDHPAMQKAIKEGDFAPIEAVLGAMGDKAKGFERFVGLAQKSYADFQAKETAATTAITTAIHTTVGGEAEWKAIREWAKKEGTPEELASLNKMLKADPVQARAAALMIKGQYDKKATGVKRPASAIRHDAGGGHEPAPQKNLTRREAVQMTNELRHTLRVPDITKTAEYAAIWARVPR